MKLLILFLSFCLANAKVYFKEEFASDNIPDNWIQSTHKSDYGKFAISSGKFFNDKEKDRGIKTTEDAHFYDISAKFDSFSNEGKTLVIQFQIKHEQSIDCGGGYLKILPGDFDQKDFHGETPYNIMFGPDICGSTRKVHVIFNYKGENHLIKKEISPKDDELSHIYTLILKSDNTYQVLIDNEKVQDGTLEDDWDMLKPKKIKDPEAKKPSDWVDDAKMDDPTDKKPDDWEKPKTIADPKATKPDDWDDEMDGEWEAPQIANPEYKGDWKPKQIDNPNYKGPWIHPEIDNPEYKPDSNLYLYKNIGGVGIDLWQVKSGTIFDNIFIGDDVEEAKKFGEETWKKTHEGEKAMKDKHDEEERKKQEEEDKKRKEEEEKNKKEEPEEKAEEDKETKDDEKKTEEDKSQEKIEL